MESTISIDSHSDFELDSHAMPTTELTTTIRGMAQRACMPHANIAFINQVVTGQIRGEKLTKNNCEQINVKQFYFK